MGCEYLARSLEYGGLTGFVSGLREGRNGVMLDAPPPGGAGCTRVILSWGFDRILFVVHASLTARSAAWEAAEGLVDTEDNLLRVVLNGRP